MFARNQTRIFFVVIVAFALSRMMSSCNDFKTIDGVSFDFVLRFAFVMSCFAFVYRRVIAFDVVNIT